VGRPCAGVRDGRRDEGVDEDGVHPADLQSARAPVGPVSARGPFAQDLQEACLEVLVGLGVFARARSRVAPAIVLAAELVLLAFGFAIGATIRQVSADGPPGCCTVTK
jgi:hypothetical protein